MIDRCFYNEDCIAGSKKHIADSSVDLIVTDPPYGICGESLHKHYNRNEKIVLDGYIDIPPDKYEQFTFQWISEAARVLKPGGSIYIVSGYTNLHHILNALHKTKLKEINHIIWKYNFGVYTRKKWVSSHYHILYYVKPGASPTFNTYCRYSDSEKAGEGGSLNYRDREDVWIINREYKPGEIKNKNELPTELLIKIIQYSSNEGDLVCDFFLGGFSTARVALGLNRRVCGFELSNKAFKHHVLEIEKCKSGFMLPEIRKPAVNIKVNSGKPLNKGERDSIRQMYKSLVEKGYTKKRAIDDITNKVGRGYWSILKIIDGTTNKSTLTKVNIQNELFG